MITVIKPDWEWVGLTEGKIDQLTKHIELCGRTCYKSEDRITDDSAEKFVGMICRRNHESVLEHEVLTARIVCSRACSHQLVRHRIAAYSQESMRYCNYKKKGQDTGLQVICPHDIGLAPGVYDYHSSKDPWIKMNYQQGKWLAFMEYCYAEYCEEIEAGIRPEDARFVLPQATKTEVVSTFNLRMWRHLFRERALNQHAQWEIREIFSDILKHLSKRVPAIFGDI